MPTPHAGCTVLAAGDLLELLHTLQLAPCASCCPVATVTLLPADGTLIRMSQATLWVVFAVSGNNANHLPGTAGLLAALRPLLPAALPHTWHRPLGCPR
jgi:hypothetical protein